MKTLEDRKVEVLEGSTVALWLIVFLLTFIFLSMTCRADSTFVPIAPEKPTVCQKVCPVCGHCVARPFGRVRKYGGGVESEYTIYACTSDHGDTTRSFNVLDSDRCDSIVWGRYREICRVDTTSVRVPCPDGPTPVKGMPGIYWGCTAIHWGYKFDTIHVDDPRCPATDTLDSAGRLIRQLPPPKIDEGKLIGLGMPRDPSGTLITVEPQVWVKIDSCYVLPHDTILCHWKIGAGSMDGRTAGLKKCDTIRVGNCWEYFEVGRDGKRKNIRTKK